MSEQIRQQDLLKQISQMLAEKGDSQPSQDEAAAVRAVQAETTPATQPPAVSRPAPTAPVEAQVAAPAVANTIVAEDKAPAASEASTADACEDTLDDMFRRIQQISDSDGQPVPAGDELVPTPGRPASALETALAAAPQDTEASSDFLPLAPANFLEARLTDTEVEALVLKYLLSRGDATGRDISEQIALPFRLIDELLVQLKRDQMVAHKRASTMNDYVYQLSDLGRERARRYSEECSYFGTAPVALCDYIASVKAQSLQCQHPTEVDLRRAFSDLLISETMFRRLGPAINSGKGMFLFGAAGNGKTSIAERVTSAFGKHIWIPRAIGVDGEVMRLFDPINHVEAPLDEDSSIIKSNHVDKRWIRIERPTIVVGGELTMANLEVTLNTATGISESPMQLKSNCGTLVIDDFGRQRMSTDELLNRWIVPLEKRYDYLNLASGKKIQVPFDQLVIFSTNLEPSDLVDEAFLRRIPYKIEAMDPEEGAFRELFKIMAKIVGCEYDADAVDYLVETHYKAVQRPYRCCQPRDLLLQIKNLCLYESRPAKMTRESMDFAVDAYFSVM